MEEVMNKTSQIWNPTASFFSLVLVCFLPHFLKKCSLRYCCSSVFCLPNIHIPAGPPCPMCLPSQGVTTSPPMRKVLQESHHCCIFTFIFTSSSPFFSIQHRGSPRRFPLKKTTFDHLCVQSYAQHLGKAQGTTQDKGCFTGLYFLRPGKVQRPLRPPAGPGKDGIHTGTSWLKHTIPGGTQVDSGAFVWLENSAGEDLSSFVFPL